MPPVNLFYLNLFYIYPERKFVFMKKIFISILFLISQFAFAQNNFKYIVNMEKKQFEYQMQMSEINYPSDYNINVTYYKLNLNLTYNPDYLRGIVTVNAKSNVPSLDSFYLDLTDTLKVDSVTSGGKLLSFKHADEKLSITLDKPYNIDDEFSVKIYYQGVPVPNGFGSFEFGSHDGGKPAIWSLSEPYGASDWWPCKNTPADKADSSDVWITCDTSLTAVSNGSLEKIVNNANGTHTFEWKNHYPIAQYLISVALADYVKYTTYFHYTASDSMPVENFIYPETFSSVKSDLDKTTTMLKVFSERYGPYPFLREKYGQVQFGWGGGMEHQTATSLGAFGQDIQAHELSHQWFGDKITCKDWKDIWLNEGFATYSEAVYFEATQGDTVYRSMIQQDMQNAKRAKGSVYVQDTTSVNSIFNGDRTYDKGAVVLYMLRGITGDSTFFKILRTYASDPKVAYGVATTRDFEADAEKVYGKSLSYFFNEWIYGQNYPSYNVGWNYTSAGNGIYNITLNVSQTVNVNPSYFTMPVKIQINTSAGDTTVTIFNDAQSQQFIIAVKGKPNYLNFDPDNQILKSINITDTVDLTKPKSFHLEQNYPNPFNPVTNIKYTIPVQVRGYIPVKLVVYDVLGREVKTLVNTKQDAGTYHILFPAGAEEQMYSSGVYFYSLTAGDYHSTKKMLLLK